MEHRGDRWLGAFPRSVWRGRDEPATIRRGGRAGRQDEDIKFVLLWFTDIEGHLKSFSITIPELEGALDDGMGFDGSSISGCNAIEESDMVAIPDPDTFQIMPRTGAPRWPG